MPQLDISTYGSQLFWLALSLGFLVLALRVSIIPRYLTLLKARAKSISHHRKEAEEAESAVKTLALKTEELKTKATHELRKLIARERHALSEENTQARETIFAQERKRLRFELKRIADADAKITAHQADLGKQISDKICDAWKNNHD